MGTLSLRKYRPGVNNGYAVIALLSILLWTTLGGHTRVAAADGEISNAAPADEDQDIPTVIAATCGDIETRAKELSVAIPGGDSQTVVKILSTCIREQRQRIADAYWRMCEKDLIKEIEKEYGSDAYFVLLAKALIVPFSQFFTDYWMVMFDNPYAIIMIQSIFTSFADDPKSATIRDIFQRWNGGPLTYGRSAGFFYGRSGLRHQILLDMYNGKRSGNTTVDATAACNDARKIFEDVNSWQLLETDSNCYAILTTRSFPQLRKIGECYARISGKSLKQTVDDLEGGWISEKPRGKLQEYQNILHYAEDKNMYFAQKLYNTVAGPGTVDEILYFLIAWRSEIDLGNIKKAYENRKKNYYHYSLYADVEDDTSGPYRDLLLALIGK